MSATTFDARAVELRDGRTVLMRCPTEDDAPALLDYLDAMRRQTDFVLWSADDPLPTLDEERQIVRGWSGPRSLHLIAEADGRIVAGAGVECPQKRKIRHRANLGISILTSHRGVGLGRVLMNELVSWCRAEPDVRKVCLSVYSENAAARALYESFGFVEEGVMKRAIRAADGRWVDEVMMGLWLDKEPAEAVS